ncbi:MAG: hypothetical protein JSS65_15100, partial [Armatimonadetes bacterium]|nr:hypothetical protein [Armatimonadota bacterium]
MLTNRAHLRYLVAAVIFWLAALAGAEEIWLGLFLGKDKLGYSYYNTTFRPGGSVPLKRVSKTVLQGKMLGQELSVLMDSETTFGDAGALAKQTFHMSSGGREMDVTAVFTAQTVEVETFESGTKKKKSLPIPPGQVVKDDPTADLIEGASTSSVCYVFDPQTISLVKTTITRKPDESIETAAGKVTAKVVMVDDPRAPTKMFLTTKGDLIKAEAPFGLEMRPVTKAEALDSTGDKADIADASTIPIDGDLEGWESAKRLVFSFDGPQ